MANIYKPERLALHDLIGKATGGDGGATILIPDLQRPFVWTPNQVTKLIDSLIRGWPFGTLLMWKINSEIKVPFRPFWKTIDRTVDEDSTPTDQKNGPTEYRMVLDGQQRIQSLIIAVWGDAWGFKLNDRDWAEEIQERRIRGRAGKYQHWTKASLCFDLDAFIESYKKNGEHVCAIDYSKVLKWAITDAQDGQSNYQQEPKNYIKPVESALINGGRLIRFSRLWEWAGRDSSFMPRQFQTRLSKELPVHQVPQDKIEKLLQPMGELLTTICAVKLSEVTFLELQSFDEEVWKEGEYMDAIVSIFTRLNTAGRTLTREEITFAWLKNGWNEAATENRNASKCFEALRKKFIEEKVTIEIDNLVGAVSTIWSILCKDGNLLENKDLLKGDVVKPMAGDISQHWNNICKAAGLVLDLLNKRDLEYKKQYYSMNALAIVWAWYSMAVIWEEKNWQTMKEPARDDFQKKTRSILEKNIDRWLFGSQWAGRWRSDTRKPTGVYAKILHKSHGEIQATKDKDLALKILKQTMERLLDDIKKDAQQGVEDIKALEPDKVSTYKDILWIWHRLDVDRWEKSEITLRTGKKEASRDVDHCISHKLWERILKEANIDNDPETYDEKNAVVNKLGNCSLLEKNFNISKSDKPMKSLLIQISEFKGGNGLLNEWASALGLNDIMLNPQPDNVEDICNKINERDKSMRAEVFEFIQGNKHRQDV